MKQLSFAAATLLLMVFSISISAQTLDEVLEGYYDAVNQEKLSSVETMKTTGKIMMMGMEIPIISYQKRPLMFRTEGTYQGMTFVQATDGEIGWMINPFMGMTEAQPMTDEDLDALLEQADIDGFLYNYEAKGMTAELTGEEDFEGTPSYVVQLTDEDGETFTFYIDKETYLPLAMKANRMVQGTEMEVTTHMGNFQEIEGMVMPMSITTDAGGQTTEIILEEVLINEPVDDSLFDIPINEVNDEETDKQAD